MSLHRPARTRPSGRGPSVVLVAALATFACPAAHAEPGVLALETALRGAREHAPALVAARSQIDAADARVDQSGSGLWPQVQAQAGYTRQTRNFAASGSQSALPGAGETSFDTEGSWAFGVSATQLIWDFGRTTGTRDAARATVGARRADAVVSARTIDRDVRQAYAEAQAQKHLLGVARETLENQARHQAQITGMIEAGTRPPIDGLQARTEHANARVALLQAENAYLAAKARLNLARGVRDAADWDVEDALPPPVAGEDAALDVLAADAEGQSPELQAQAARAEAQRRSLDAARGGFWPILDATTGLTEGGPGLADMVWNWSGALRLSWPLYQGGLTTAQASAARHELATLDAQAEATRQTLRLRVEEARLGVRGGKAALEASEEALTAARERLALAEGRYQTGLGSAIELSDAQLALTNAAAQKVRAERDVALARAQLLFALGRDGLDAP